MKRITSLTAMLMLFISGCICPVFAQETVTLQNVGSPIENLDEIIDGKQYVIWLTAQAGNSRHGLVYTKSHTCGTNNENDRVVAHNNADDTMPAVGANVESSAILTVEVDNSGNEPRYAFKTASGKYIDSADRGASTAGDPIHESTEKGWFYIVKTGGGNATLTEADCWYLKSATATGNRTFVNTGGADTGGLVLYNNTASDNGNSKLKVIPVETDVTLQSVGAPIESVEEIAAGGQYMIWITAQAGNSRHGLVYTKAHECGANGNAANNENDRVVAHNNADDTMPAAGASIEGSAIFTVEVDNSGDEPRYAFKTANGKYIDSADRGASTAGDPIHESTEKGWFYIVKTGGGNATLTEADCWYLKSATATGNRTFVNTGGADTGGLVLYNNTANDNGNSKLKIIPIGTNVALSATTNLDNAATFSHNWNKDLIAPENVKVYKIAETSDNEAQLSEITSRVIPANEGVILVSETATRANLAATTTEIAETNAYADNLLVGLPDGGKPELTAGQTAYVFTKNTDGEALFKLLDTEGSDFGANKACLVLNGQGTKALAISFGGAATGIGSVATQTNDEAPKYDLFGRRVTNVAKGSLYIQGGKKYIAK